MSFTHFIALKYLRSKKSNGFFSFLSWVSFAGIFISVAAFLIIHCVMNGFSTHLRQALTGFNSHVIVSKLGPEINEAALLRELESDPAVKSIQPVVEFHGIIQTSDGSVAGAKVRGMRLTDLKASDTVQKIYFNEEEEGSLKTDAEGVPGVLLGEDLYTRMEFVPGEEERVFLIYPFGDVGPTGEMEPRRREFRVVGVMQTGFYEFDTQYALTDLAPAQKLSGSETEYGDILVTLKSMGGSSAFANQLRERHPELKVETWESRNQRLFHALKLERVGMFLLLSIVTFIASFNILGLMSLLALSKSREMALFYALGLDAQAMQKIFRSLGAFLGLLGTACGFAFGLAVVYWLKAHPLPLPPAYYLDSLPVKVDWRMLLFLSTLAPVFTVLASAWPAYQASRINPAELLKEG